MGKQNLRGGPHGRPGDYAEELGPLLWLSETGAGWLGDAGEYCGETRENCDAVVLTNCEYCGETGENCEAGVLSTCEPGETAESAVLAWLPNILSKRRRAPRCLPLPGWRAKWVGACGGMQSADELRCGVFVLRIC